MPCLVHISDLHFGREVPAVADAMLAAIRDIAPDAVLFSGDLTQRGRRSEYRRAADFLERLPAPLCAVPGNHDLAAFNLVARFLRPWAHWKQYVGDDLEPTLPGAGFMARGINTARLLGDRMDWSRGGINAAQVEQVSATFTGVEDDALRLLLAHHPFWLPGPHAHRHLVDGGEAALPRLADAGVDLILSGHIHVAFSRVLDGMIVSHAGTGISDRLLPGFPNSFNLIRGDRDRLGVELLEWRGEMFQSARTQWFARDADGWRESENGSAVETGR